MNRMQTNKPEMTKNVYYIQFVELCVLVARLNDDLITMTLNRRPMRPLSDNSSRPADSETQVCSSTAPRI